MTDERDDGDIKAAGYALAIIAGLVVGGVIFFLWWFVGAVL
jgi:hypothetical protein